MNQNSPLFSGIDIGGSHITAALINMNIGHTVDGSVKRCGINAMADADEMLDAWSQLISKSWQPSFKPAAIGIAMPGPFDYQQGISWIRGQHKFESLYGLNIKKLLAERLGVHPENIYFTNDAECFLLGETYSGAAKGYQSVIGITLGTGLGSAIYKNGVSKDANLWCTPFENAIAEEYLSTRWFVKRYKELSGVTVENVKELSAITDQPFVETVFHEFGINLGKFLLPFIENEEAEAVVLGGNISRVYHLFQKPLIAFLQSHHCHAAIVTTSLGEHAALIGAATACSTTTLVR